MCAHVFVGVCACICVCMWVRTLVCARMWDVSWPRCAAFCMPCRAVLRTSEDRGCWQGSDATCFPLLLLCCIHRVLARLRRHLLSPCGHVVAPAPCLLQGDAPLLPLRMFLYLGGIGCAPWLPLAGAAAVRGACPGKALAQALNARLA